MNNYTERLIDFIDNSPTAFHVIENVRLCLRENGYNELFENEKWDIKRAGKYFVVRNDSSLIAFNIGKEYERGFNILAAHTDSPVFKIKEISELHSEAYTRINTEGYGGMILSSWFDRPLSVAGRVMLDEGGRIKKRLLDFKRDLLLIPSVAIHLSRDNDKKDGLNKQVDLMPLYSLKSDKGSFLEQVAKELMVSPDSILGSDLFVYNRQKASIWGRNLEFISSRSLDDQQCVFCGLEAFLSSENNLRTTVLALFDNEETGSGTKQGADSTFLEDTLKRLNAALGYDSQNYCMSLADSFMLSADNAHAVHPNHPELTDTNNCVHINEGVVVKFHAGAKYTTDAVSAAIVKNIAKLSGVPVQYFANRSDKAGGSTLGNISTSHVSIKCADVGIAQLAMHSSYETAGVDDTENMIKLIKTMYESVFREDNEGGVYIR